MATTADGIVYPIASDFIAPLNTHLQTLAESTQDALDGRAPATLTTYTPTFTGLTLGNGTVVAKYCKVGGVIVDNIVITFGSTTAVTGGVSIGGLQAANFTGPTICGNVNLHDAGIAYNVGLPMMASSTGINIFSISTSGSFAQYASLNATSPHTWSTGDQIVVNTVRLAA